MAQAEYAYDVSPQRRMYEVERPPLRVLSPEQKPRARTQSLARPLIRCALATSAVCFVVVVLLGLASITLSNATVQALINSESLANSIAEARSAGLELEVEYSVATNPTRIQNEASALGMSAAPEISTLEAAESPNASVIASMSAAFDSQGASQGNSQGASQGASQGDRADTASGG